MLKILQTGETQKAAPGVCPAQQMRMATPAPISDLEGRHPCYSFTPEGHRRSGRLHIPASPACNIQCRFCRRDFNGSDARPGVARRLIAPEEAVSIVRRSLELCPAIQVIGIAGPGDTLATDHAVRTLSLIHEAFPHLIKCLSTNGLLLEERAEELVRAGVRTITVTVNAIDPKILESICAGVFYRGKRLWGVEAAQLLIGKQLAGIRRMSGLGAVVKINTVLVPGINEEHIEKVAEAAAAVGASLINVIPLIPQHEMAAIAAPDMIQLHDARRAAARHLPVFSHCSRCRADACGIPGETDYSFALYGSPVAAATFSHG